MKKVDYIIVGLGLAGIAFAEQLRKHSKSFVVIDASTHSSSRVAAGVYNPIVLKRFTAAWKAREQMSILNEHYSEIEDLIKIKINYKIPVLRKFNSSEEQNDWFAASDRPVLDEYLALDLIENINHNLIAPLGYGRVNETGRIDTTKMLGGYAEYLQTNNNYINNAFNYSGLNIEKDCIEYQDIQAKRILFSEGFGLIHNPFFSKSKLVGNKGEVLIIKSSSLKLNAIIKSSIFLVPLGEDLYYVGATYNWQDKDYRNTETSRQELIEKLESLIKCNYTIVEHKAAIRPTTVDRRPLIGKHILYDNLLLLNGLGTRGVMIAPYIAEKLYKHVELGAALDPEIDIKRFQ